VCKEHITTIRESEIECESCKSIIYSDENDNTEVIKSGLKFNFTYFILSLIFLGGGIFMILLKFVENFKILYTGLILTIIPITGILRDFHGYDSLWGIISALFEKRIVYYDSGSKYASYIYILIFSLGLILLILGLLLKI